MENMTLIERLTAAIDEDGRIAFAAAHRKILKLHAPFIADEDNADPICQTCLEGSHLYDVSAYPCPTLRLLAEAYGIGVDHG